MWAETCAGNVECNIVLVYAAVASMLLSRGTFDSSLCIYIILRVCTKMTLASYNNIDCTSTFYHLTPRQRIYCDSAIVWAHVKCSIVLVSGGGITLLVYMQALNRCRLSCNYGTTGILCQVSLCTQKLSLQMQLLATVGCTRLVA